MHDLFDAASRREILDRLDRLTPDSPRQWGKMTPAQMLAHCANALEVANGDQPKKQILIGRLFGPLVRKKFLGEAPFPHNSPTDPPSSSRTPATSRPKRRACRRLPSASSSSAPTTPPPAPTPSSAA
jgi:hypothetical protein